MDATPDQMLSGLDELDSMIVDEFQANGIASNHYRTSSVEVDSSFTRKVYRVRVASRFSKTQFHLALHQKLNAYKIDTPAQVTMPDNDIRIHIYKDETVIRTIILQTDKDLVERQDEG